MTLTLLVLAFYLLSVHAGYWYGRARGHRDGLRTAARICAESNTDPRPAFASWLNEVGEVRR